MGKTSSTVKNRWNAKAYDQLPIRIPKGQKATIQAAADEVGESINQFTSKALLTRMGREEWPTLEGEQKQD